MNRTDFDALVTEQVKRTADLLVRKGAEYAGDADRLANFKRNAAKNGQTVLETWQTYWGKHVDSINSFISRVKDRAMYLALQEILEEHEKLIERLPSPGARSQSDSERLSAIIDPEVFRDRVNVALPDAVRWVELQLSEPIVSRFDDNINYSFLGAAIITELQKHTTVINGDSRP